MSFGKYRITSVKLLLVLIILLSQAFMFDSYSAEQDGEDINYCTDKESWKEWDDLIVKYPDDEDITILHALRLGLCAKVSRGDISVRQATDIFEKARDIIMIKKESTSKKGNL